MEIEEQINKLEQEKGALHNKMSLVDDKLNHLYKKLHGDLSDYEYENLRVLKEVELRTGFGKSVRDERKGWAPGRNQIYREGISEHNSHIVEAILVSDEDFKILGYKEFEDHTFSIKGNESFLYKKKDSEIHHLVFRNPNPKPFWVEGDLFWMSNQNKEKFKAYSTSTFDYLPFHRAKEEYLLKLRKNETT